MTQPIWLTPEGNLGTVLEGGPVIYQFTAQPYTVGNTIQYELLNGVMPQSTSIYTTFTLSTSGSLTGTPKNVAEDTISYFTVRLKEYNGSTLVGFSDRTFSITVEGTTTPYFTTPSGPLYSGPDYLLDSTWDPYQILYVNTDPNTTAVVELVAGELPPGLEITTEGLIRGYAYPPFNSSGLPITLTYNFTLEVKSESGSDLRSFSITVKNQQLLPGFVGREPVIFNVNHPAGDQTNNQYYPFFIYNSTGSLGTLYQDNNVIFKIIGNDWAGQPLTYNLTGTLPNNLTFDSTQGWIKGQIITSSVLVDTFNFSVTVTNTATGLTSNVQNFSMIVLGEIDNTPINLDITWLTPSNLGTINNGSISTFNVQAIAESGVSLNYTMVSGSLPQGLQLKTNGEIMGRVEFETETTLLPEYSTVIYTFTVQVQNTIYPEITSQKTFTINLYQKFDTPYENVYIRAYPSYENRSILLSLVQNFNLIPFEYLYRQDDPYFGKSSSIIYQHIYGVPASSINNYIDALCYNHYWRNITLGPIKTAIAKNENNEIIYEVVYSEIIDDLVNKDKVSISKVVNWPRLINGTISTVYPNSLQNMEDQVVEYIPGQITDNSILPLWMTGQQQDGSSLGFIRAWVICYTKPGYSNIIKNNIETQWPYKLNEINFTLDRIEVDKSYTFEYVSGNWTTLPSGGISTDDENINVYFPRKNILSEC